MFTAQGCGVSTPIRLEPGQLLAAVAKSLIMKDDILSSIVYTTQHMLKLLKFTHHILHSHGNMYAWNYQGKH